MKVENKDKHVLLITRSFAAPRELVFKAWTTPEMVKNWWGCKEFPACHIEMDVRSGGVWRGCLRSDEGNEIRLDGKFIEVTRPERLVFTFVRESAPNIGIEPVDTLVTVVFTERKGETIVELRHETFTSEELRNSHQDGWSVSLGRLEGILAAQQTVSIS